MIDDQKLDELADSIERDSKLRSTMREMLRGSGGYMASGSSRSGEGRARIAALQRGEKDGLIGREEYGQGPIRWFVTPLGRKAWNKMARNIKSRKSKLLR